MADILYAIFIFPIEQVIELFFVFIFRATKDPVLSVLGVSFAVSILTLPLYFMAEKHQQSERDMQKQMKPAVDNIRAVFFGDERFMRLSTYYRQQGYHPLYSLRSAISLIIQVPFFIAAYHFLLNLDMINNVPFGPIRNLAKPDSLLNINNLAINILPIAMTLLNCVSATVYTKGFPHKGKIQVFAMAVVFLILLYGSPSGMVLYWIGNNLFSLIKNIIQKFRHPKRITHVLVSIICLSINICLLLFNKIKNLSGAWHSQYIALALILAVIPFLPFLYSFIHRKEAQRNNCRIFYPKNESNLVPFVLSLLVLFMLSGVVIPSSLIVSDVQEFSYIENHTSPFPFIINATLQSLGIFLIWPLCIYQMLSKRARQAFSKMAVVLAFIAIANVFIFPGKYGQLSISFVFSEGTVSSMAAIAMNLLSLLFLIVLVLFFDYKYNKFLPSALIVISCTFGLISFINIAKINDEFISLRPQLTQGNEFINEPVYHFTKTGKNILVIMLDKAMGPYIPYIFEEKPELLKSFDGFTWFRNTVSFANHTLLGAPGIYGGYEYTPIELQTNRDISLGEKYSQALLLLPKLFIDNGFNIINITDHPLENYTDLPYLSYFDGYTQINVKNVKSKYNDQWLLDNNKNELDLIAVTEVINSNLIRFSFFKYLPLFLRNIFYDNGNWLLTRVSGGIYKGLFLDNYIALDILPAITTISLSESNICNFIQNSLPHIPVFLQAPDYIPANTITNKGNGPLANEQSYHSTIASFILLGKWFDFLQENNVYDNTRIIIVSDHGSISSPHSKFSDNIILPNGNYLEAFAALLMVKDFNDQGTLFIDNGFMTNADVPFLALRDIIKNPVNPWSGKEISTDKTNGVTITTASLWAEKDFTKSYFNIRPDEWLHVQTDVFDPKNWSQVRK